MNRRAFIGGLALEILPMPPIARAQLATQTRTKAVPFKN